VIREAQPAELPAAEDTLVAAFTTGCWVAEEYEQGLRTLRQRAETWHIWIAASEAGQVLGVVLTPRLEYWTADHFTFSVLAVHPSGRGLRIGSALTDHAIALARIQGFRVIEINSSPQMSAAHKLYYRKGFVRRPERETAIVSEYGERLLTFIYHIPDQRADPLPAPFPGSPPPASRAQRQPNAGPPWSRRPDRSLWPPRPPGGIDQSGAFVPDAVPSVPLARAESVTRELAARGWLAPDSPGAAESAQRVAAELGGGALAALWSETTEARQAAVRLYFAKLDTLERRLAASAGPFLAGTRPGRADIYLFSFLLAYDLGWRAGFSALGGVADWPHLWRQARLTLSLAGLSPAQRQAAGLEPDADAVYPEPYGPLPPVPGVPDVRAAWLTPRAELRRRKPPRDPAVPVLAYPADWPGPDPAAARVRLERARARIAALASSPPPTAAPTGPTGPHERTGQDPAALVDGIVHDLLDPLEDLLTPSSPNDQLARWRLFWARLGWLEARLSSRPHLAGGHPTAADQALHAVLEAYPADLRDFPRIQALVASGKAGHLATHPDQTEAR
jgi:putative glutathione S-transferase